MLKHISLLSVAALAATFSGLIREAVLAYVFGTSYYGDAVATAIFLHDTVTAALVTGGFSFAVMPVLAACLDAGGEADGVALVTATSVWATILSGACAVAAFVALTPIVTLAMHDAGPERGAAMALILQGALPALVLMTIAATIAAFLPGFGRYAQPSIARLVWNAGIVVGLGLATRLEAPLAISVALVVGAIGSLVVVVLSLPDYRRQQLRVRNASLRPLLKVAAPSLLAVSSVNASLGLWERYLLAGVGVGSIAVVNYAQRASYVASTISAAVHVVSFTALTRYAKDGTIGPSGVATLESVSRRYLLLLIPMMCFMVAARGELIALLFGRGAFNAESVARTAAAFGVYSTAVLPVFVLGLFVRALFVLQRPWTGIAALGLTALVSAVADRLLVPTLGELAIPAGYALGTLLGAVGVLWYVDVLLGSALFRGVAGAAAKALALGTAGLGAYALLNASLLARSPCATGAAGSIGCLSGRLTAGFLAFTASAVLVGNLLGIEDIRQAWRWVRVRLGRPEGA